MAMEASLFSSGKSNAGSSATQNNGDDWKQQTTALGHKTHGADHGHRSVDDSSFLFGEEWEVIDESGNSLSRDDNPSPRFAGIVPETRTGTKEADRVTRKWEDAGKTHGFSVRGQTYLTVRNDNPFFVLCLCNTNGILRVGPHQFIVLEHKHRPRNDILLYGSFEPI